MKGSEFVFDYVQFLYYKCHKINPSCGGFHSKGKKQKRNDISLQ